MTDAEKVEIRTHWEGCWKDPAHHGCAVKEVERLTQLLANVFDNLNDAPISDEWARLTCDRISAALEVNHDAK